MSSTDKNISIFTNHTGATQLEDISIGEYIGATAEGKWKDVTLRAREVYEKEGNSQSYKQAKSDAPFITLSSTLRGGGHGANRVVGHTGYLLADIDEPDNPHIDNFSPEGDPYIVCSHRSIGGHGLAIIFRIDPNYHLESFYAIRDYLKDNYSLNVDKLCSNVTRGRYASYDPELYQNLNAKLFDASDYEIPEQTRSTTFETYTPDHDEVLAIARQMAERKPDLIDTYDDYLRIGFALVAGLGEQGRDIYHVLCEGHPSYNARQADEKYDNCLASHDPNGITMGTFYYYAKQAGVQVIAQKPVRPASDETPEQALAGIKALNDAMDKKPNLDQAFFLTKRYIDSLGLRLSEITGRIELPDGTDIPDKYEALIAAELRTVMPPSCVNLRRIEEILDGTTQRYNPILDYLAEIGNTPSTGVIDAVLDTIVLEEPSTEQIKPLIKKWMVSLVASPHGKTPELVLVLSGKPRSGKSSFFKYLLPKRLRKKFLAEGTFEQGARGNELTFKMAETLLYFNDEMSGMRHADWNRFKAATSSEYSFERAAYGRRAQKIRRLAVLGGSTNEFYYMSDETGNRRIINVNLNILKYDEFLAIDKDALFSELLAEYMADPEWSWRLNKEDTDFLKDSSEYNRFKFDHEVILEESFRPATDDSDPDNIYFLPATQILAVLQASYPYVRRIQVMQMGQTMRNLGFTQTTARIEGKPKKGYLVEDLNNVMERATGIFGFDIKLYKR